MGLSKLQQEEAYLNKGRVTADTLFHHVWGKRYDFHSDESDLAETPMRFFNMLLELTTPKDFEFTSFSSDRDEMVIVQDIPFVTLCAHHVLPFMGVAHIGYVPNGKIAGLSKLARCVEYFASGLNVQEDLTHKIATAIEAAIDPLGVAVVMKAEHTCMTIRGVQAVGTKTSTSVMRGVFADHDRLARTEFFQLIEI